MRLTVLTLLAPLALTLLCGCGARSAPPAALTAAEVEALRPADTRLAAAYERSCLLCHGRPGSGAPATGDTAAWAPRLAKGLDGLLASARDGLGGMPAMGLCADCSEAELRQLILFMSAAPAANKP
ncbi:c-type cytochrome [Roseateles saccharophilus]|uniref:Cytochrome c5 n=1 Tax=Roseateles saccharophilus TaxID=304 RepID=A0A4R3UWG6_ROSSA|nr:c-type cytochrome [Roseateles saccharophilus]MDG0832704.1 cytochrome c5 family protein [Roseateles saccharophilus]TCU95360.1 cytochrome c5 [Roseateles saccharophilus]